MNDLLDRLYTDGHAAGEWNDMIARIAAETEKGENLNENYMYLQSRTEMLNRSIEESTQKGGDPSGLITVKEIEGRLQDLIFQKLMASNGLKGG
jgi:hypothetical protein